MCEAEALGSGKDGVLWGWAGTQCGLSEISPLAAEGWLPKGQSGGLCMRIRGTALVLLMSQHCIAFLSRVQQSLILLRLYSFPSNGHVQFCL